MAKPKEPVNPFYAALLVLGILFSITAIAYFVMTLRGVAPAVTEEESHPLMTFLDTHGVSLMGGELALLAVATVGAMWLDGVRYRRQQAERPDSRHEQNGN